MALLAETGVLITCFRHKMWVGALFFTALLAFLGLCFFSLCVTVHDGAIRLKFGLGFLRRDIPLADVLSARAVRNSYLSGWGVRRLRRAGGWSYGVSGWDAVELSLKNGRILRIGTDDPHGLLAAIGKR